MNLKKEFFLIFKTGESKHERVVKNLSQK